jgi:hypothetical protein
MSFVLSPNAKEAMKSVRSIIDRDGLSTPSSYISEFSCEMSEIISELANEAYVQNQF